MVIGTPVVLNLIPGGVNKVVHVNQVNDNIEIQFQIMNGSQPYNVTEGVSCTIRGTKGDSYGYTAEAATTVGSNVVTVTLTEQLTAVAGGCNVFELVFVGAENSMKVSTENFILAVERAALGEDTVISDSDLAYAAQVLDQLQSVGAVNAQVQQNKANIAAETTRATTAEQTLQQNINSEASARQSADNTLQSNINAEASARATQDNVLQAEIDQLLAPSGSAPSAAEVENARVGADGTVYSTLGDAIRGQVTDVKSQIEQLAVPAAVESGYINALGAVGNSTYYDHCDFVDISDFIRVTFNPSFQSNMGLAFYQSDKTTTTLVVTGDNCSDYGYTSSAVPQKVVFDVPDGSKYLRFTRRNAYDVTVNAFAVIGANFSGLVEKVRENTEALSQITPNDYVKISGTDQVTTKNTEFLDTVYLNAFDGNYTDGYMITGSGSIASGYTLSANSARYNLAIIPVKPNTKYTIVGGIASGTIAVFRCITATRLLSSGESFDGSFVLNIANATNPYYYTFTTSANDKYLYVYGLNYTSDTRPFIQLAEGEINGFTTNQYNVYYGVPNDKMLIPSGSGGIRIVPVSSTRFNVLVYDQASKLWITHTFRKAYITHTLPYGNGQSKSVVTSDVWYAEYIKDPDGNNLMQGNTNFIHYLDNTGHQGHVGAGHGCAVAVYTLFFADGQLIDPTSLTGEVECSVFRMTEKVNHYLIDQASTTSSSDAIPSLDENGDPIVESVEYLDAEWTINNTMKLRNRLNIVMDGLKFQQCFAGMLTGYYPYFDNIMINNPEYIYNGLSGSGSDITIEAKGGTTTVLSSNSGGYFDADEVIMYGNKYRVSTRIVANDPSRYSKLNVETAAMPPNYDSRIKAYFMPCVCTQSYPLIQKGEQVETFNTGDILDVMIFKKLDVSA